MIYTEDQVRRETLKYFNGDELATNVWISKYALKDREGNLYELTPKDMHKRLAKEFARIESKYPNPLSEDRIFELLDKFKFLVPQGSPMFGIGNDFTITSLSNCFVIGSNDDSDSYGSIMRTDQEQIQLMKRRGGVGHDISHLRPSGAMANNSVLKGMAGSTLYMERYSNSTREVSQGDRRGALMLSIDITHPDAEKFIDAKLEKGKVTGANISVKLTDEFMRCVKDNDDTFIQCFPIDFNIDSQSWNEIVNNDEDYPKNELIEVKSGVYIKKIHAKKLWNKIIHNAWKSAEPGLLFWDTILRESPAACYGKEWKERSTNPCFTGDTIIAVADGRNGVSIKELSEKNEKFLVYSGRKNKSNGNRGGGWKQEIKEAVAFKTGVKKIIEVTLSDNSKFKCTKDHKLALPNGEYIEAIDSIGLRLEKFYSFSNKNDEKSYRHINSKTNGYSKQYRMLWEYFNESYDGKSFNIDHIDDDSKNDLIENLQLISIKDHKKKTKRFGEDNPIQKIKGTEYLSLYCKRSSIQANGAKYDWSDEEIENKLIEFDLKYGKKLEELRPKDLNIDLSEDVFVEDIKEIGIEDVYDLNVVDNHNFYIITKTDDEYFLNSSGILVHNCSELPLCEYDSCRLLAINLYSYVNDKFTENSHFNFELFKYHVSIAHRLMDDIVDLEIEKIDKILDKINSDPESEDLKKVELNLWIKIKEKAIQGRRTGLGITGLGDMLAALNLRYGSEEAIEFSEEVHKVLAVESYNSSINLAKERGCFSIWDYEKEKENPFIKRIALHLGHEGLSDYRKYGRRNIANLTIAPTGSVSILTQTTSGIEPCFQVYYKRRRKVNDKLKATFIDELGDMWEEYKVFHHKFVEWFKINVWNDLIHKSDRFALLGNTPLECLNNFTKEQLDEFVKESPYYKATSSDVDYLGKVEMQGKIQKWIDHSISVTVNMPENVSEETVSQVYMKAYECDCKGVTVYREGSRNGVLISDKKEEKQSIEAIIYNDAPKRPKTLKCDIYTMSRSKQSFTIIVGLLGDRPYEIFALEKLDNLEFCDKIQKGELKKVKSRTYQLIGDYKGQRYIVDNIVEHMSDDEQKDTRKYSIQLRHGIHPKYIIEQIAEYASITSFDKVIAKVLSNYLGDKKIKGEETCPNCGGQLKYESGCVQCLNPECGWSKCS